MPGFLGGAQNAAQPKQPFGPQLKSALVQAAPLFSAMASGYSSGRGPYAYLDQGIAGMQAMQKQKRDEEAAAAAAAAFGGLMTPGGLGGATKSSMGGGGKGAPGGYYGGTKAPEYPLGVDALPQSPTTPGGYSMGTEVKSYIPEDVKNGIFAGESGGDYNALFGFSNREGGKFANVKLTDMTIDEALAFAAPSGEYGQTVKGQIGRVATPMGAYQIVGTTLRAAKEGLGLTGNEKMTPELQDMLGGWIYANQGTGAWEGYRGPQSAPEGGWGGNSVTMSAKGEPSGPVDPLADPYVQRLMQVMAMPGITPEQQAVIQLQLQTRMGQLTAQAEPTKLQTFTDANGVVYKFDPIKGTAEPMTEPEKPEQGYRLMTPNEVKEAGLPPGSYQVGPKGEIKTIGGGGTSVTVNNGGGPELGKLSTDYGYVRGADGLPKIDPNTGLPTAAPVPGSPAALAQEAEAAAGDRKTQNQATSTDVITTAAQRARAAAEDRVATGLLGQAASLNPATKNAEVYRQVDVLKSNAKIENLQAMRDASKTGGALGAVTAPELKMLEDKAGSLDPASPYFQRDLDDYERTLLRTVHGQIEGDRIYEATRTGDPAPITAPTGTPAPTGGNVMKFDASGNLIQ